MVTVSFTGSRRLPPACEDQVWARLRRLADQANNGMISEFVSGAADGIDTFVAVNLSAWCPDTRHRLVVPAAGHNRLLAQEWESSRNPNLKVERMLVQPGPAALQYRLRDQRMVGPGRRWVGGGVPAVRGAAPAPQRHMADSAAGTQGRCQAHNQHLGAAPRAVLSPDAAFRRTRSSPGARGRRRGTTGPNRSTQL